MLPFAYPERVRSLTIIPGSLPGYRWSDNTARLVAAIIDMAAAGNFLRANQMVLELVPTAAEIPSVRGRLEEMLKEYSWVHVLTGNVALNRPLAPPAAERLAEITVATLIIQGEADIQDFQKVGALLEERISGARRIVVSEAGHLVNMERPDEFNRILLGFLRSH